MDVGTLWHILFRMVSFSIVIILSFVFATLTEFHHKKGFILIPNGPKLIYNPKRLPKEILGFVW